MLPLKGKKWSLTEEGYKTASNLYNQQNNNDE